MIRPGKVDLQFIVTAHMVFEESSIFIIYYDFYFASCMYMCQVEFLVYDNILVQESKRTAVPWSVISVKTI